MIEPLYFGDSAAPLFGVLNRAEASSAVDRGVVICAPLGYENVVYYRQLGILARRLSVAGRSTLRFDWPGSGDSAGDDTQPRLVAAYLESVSRAIEVLRAATGLNHIDLVGLRIGATLAASAVAAGSEAADLVLWDPFLTGRDYIRAMRTFDRFSRKPTGLSDDSQAEGQPASGFVIAPATVRDLERLDLTKIEYGAPRRVLVAGRPAQPDEPLLKRFRGLGHDVSSAVFEELREVALGWAERPVPTDAFAQIESWLTPGRPSGRVGLGWTPQRIIELPIEGVAVREEAVVLQDGSTMLGVVTTPAELSFDDSWIVFVPNRYARRVGPNRLYTEWARDWAAAGVASLRIDVNGTGDAGGPDGETDRDMYRPHAVSDVLRSVSFLREQFDARRFAVMGLCSGGYVGFHAALKDSSIEAVILLNPQMLLWTEQETPLTRAGILCRAALRPSSWKRLLTTPKRRVRLAAMLPEVGEAVVSHVRWRFDRLSRRSREGKLSVRDWIVAAIDRLEARECRVLFVFSEGDAGRDYLTRHLGPSLPGLAERPNVSLETVPGADHTFRHAGRQAALRDLLEQHLDASGFAVRARSRERL